MITSTDRLAIHGGPPAKKNPYGAGIRYGKAEEEAVLTALRSEKLCYIEGTEVFGTEKVISDTYKVSHTVLCSSGSAAIHSALAVCGVGPGDEVIVNPITDWGSVLGILALGAVPIFCDIDEVNFSLNPACLERLITSKTKAILIVHMYGYPAYVEEILQIAGSHGIHLIEDCAQAHYAFVNGRPLGTFGTIGAFSTNDTKHVSSGEGGFLITNDSRLAKVLRLFTDKGYDRDLTQRGVKDPAFLAYNYRMSELNAALLRVQIQSIQEQIDKRVCFAQSVIQHMQDVRGYSLLKIKPGSAGSYWGILGQLDLKEFNADRKMILEAILAEGILASTALSPTRILYLTSVFRKKTLYPMDENRTADFLKGQDYHEGLCRNAEKIESSSLILRCSPFYTEEDAIEIANGIRKVLNYFRR